MKQFELGFCEEFGNGIGDFPRRRYAAVIANDGDDAECFGIIGEGNGIRIYPEDMRGQEPMSWPGFREAASSAIAALPASAEVVRSDVYKDRKFAYTSYHLPKRPAGREIKSTTWNPVWRFYATGSKRPDNR